MPAPAEARAAVTGSVGRRHDDHDPGALDARAARLDAAVLTVDGRRARLLVAEARDAAALLRRLADDLRIIERLLREVNLLAPLDDDGAQAGELGARVE